MHRSSRSWLLTGLEQSCRRYSDTASKLQVRYLQTGTRLLQTLLAHAQKLKKLVAHRSGTKLQKVLRHSIKAASKVLAIRNEAAADAACTCTEAREAGCAQVWNKAAEGTQTQHQSCK